MNWTGIFKNKFVVHGQHIRFPAPLLISIYQKWLSELIAAIRIDRIVFKNWGCSLRKLSMMYRKGAIHMTEIERPLLAPKGLIPIQYNVYHCIMLLLVKCTSTLFTCTISHVHRRAPNMVLQARNLVYKKIMICEGLLWFLFLRPLFNYIY